MSDEKVTLTQAIWRTMFAVVVAAWIITATITDWRQTSDLVEIKAQVDAHEVWREQTQPLLLDPGKVGGALQTLQRRVKALEAGGEVDPPEPADDR